MNIIDSVEIKGFWGNHTVQFRTHEDFNFIIGLNGSGKTTTLNLIAGVLQADKDALSNLEFDSVKIILKDLKSRKKAVHRGCTR
jgi:ABC-type Fe3+/spermidine/putrescine transport system ATPase subunit